MAHISGFGASIASSVDRFFSFSLFRKHNFYLMFSTLCAQKSRLVLAKPAFRPKILKKDQFLQAKTAFCYFLRFSDFLLFRICALIFVRRRGGSCMSPFWDFSILVCELLFLCAGVVFLEVGGNSNTIYFLHAHLCRRGGHFGQRWAQFGPTLGPLGPLWADFGLTLGRLGPTLGPLWFLISDF